jgi:hypothetical protein
MAIRNRALIAGEFGQWLSEEEDGLAYRAYVPTGDLPSTDGIKIPGFTPASTLPEWLTSVDSIASYGEFMPVDQSSGSVRSEAAATASSPYRAPSMSLLDMLAATNAYMALAEYQVESYFGISAVDAVFNALNSELGYFAPPVATAATTAESTPILDSSSGILPGQPIADFLAGFAAQDDAAAAGSDAQVVDPLQAYLM